jgi:hypothetical protein
MKHLGRTLYALAFVVMVSGVATCYFGVKYEIAQIPPETRAGMADPDWIATEWEILGLTIVAAGIVLAVIAIVFRAWQRSVTARGLVR